MKPSIPWRVVCVLAVGLALGRQGSAEPDTRTLALELYGQLPLAFEENQGQTDPRVRFLSRGSGYTLFLTSSEAVLSLSAPDGSPAARSAVIRMKVLGASESARAAGIGELSGRSNYLIGKDRTAWRAGVPSYGSVRYESVYPGVDLLFHGSNQRQLEYDFVVAPGADPAQIRLGFAGTDRLRLDATGNLVLRTPLGDVVERAPVAYQDVDGARRPVDVRYERKGGHEIGFRVAAYDRQSPLVIDPVLAYSTYLGGTGGTTTGASVAVDGAGNAYVTGATNSANFPTLGALKPTLTGTSDAYVAKLSPTGALVYSTYLGGVSADAATCIAVDSSGTVYLAGFTESFDFPTVNPAQPAKSALQDGFIAKLSPSGTSLVYSTFLGGTGGDGPLAIAVDGAGYASVAGSTVSNDFPTVNALQTSRPGVRDGFVARLSPDGGSFVYSTYLGGNSTDETHGIAVDGAGNAYVVGTTSSLNFPIANALQGTKPGSASAPQAFLTKFAPAGNVLVYSTFIGGATCNGTGNGVVVDAAGSAYVTGGTCATDFPVVGALQAAKAGAAGAFDAFVFKLSAAGDAIEYSTYLGGTGSDVGNSIALDGAGDMYVMGRTVSTDFPLLHAVQNANAGQGDVFVSRLSAGGNALVYSTYVGGSADEVPIGAGTGIAVDATGNAIVVGRTFSSNFPTVNPLPVTRGGEDAYVFKLVADPPPPVAPTARAGGDQFAFEATLVTLDGSASSDPNGDALNYHWEQIAGPAVTLSDPTAARPFFTAPSVPVGGATLSFRLVVDDGTHASEPDTVNITIMNVNRVPVADAGVDQAVQEGSTVTLTAGDSFDSDGDALTYEWTQTAGTPVALSDAAVSAPTFTAPAVGSGGETLAFTVTVSDGVAESTDEVQVAVSNVNQVPMAQAGSDLTIDEGAVVSLQGGGSSDPDGDSLTFAWTQIGGPTVTLSNPASATPSFTAPGVGAGGATLVFQLVVADGSSASPPDQVAVSVRDSNQPPSCGLGKASPGLLWPPNHKLVPVRIVGVADPNDESVTIEVTGVTQDEPLNGIGDGDTSPDAVLMGAKALVRAERSGPGTGRVYSLTFTATDSGGATCTGQVRVCVPHDRQSCGHHGGDHHTDCVDEGQAYNSLHP